MSEKSLSRSPHASTTRVSFALVASSTSAPSKPARCKKGMTPATRSAIGKAPCIRRQANEFVRIEAGRRFVDAFQTEIRDHLRQADDFALIVERPAKPAQVVDERGRQIAEFAIKRHGRWIRSSRLSICSSVQPMALSLRRISGVRNFFMSRLLSFFFDLGSLTTGTCANCGSGAPKP